MEAGSIAATSAKDIQKALAKRLAHRDLPDAAITAISKRVVKDGLKIGGFDFCPYGICVDYFADRRILVDKVLELDRRNPQVAARLLSALGRWRRFDPERQTLMRAQLERAVAAPGRTDQRLMREAAATKVTAARLCERVLSECAHVFGASGYLEDETPFPRLLRDSRMARLGGGSDEMMLELYAGGLEADDELYDRLTTVE